MNSLIGTRALTVEQRIMTMANGMGVELAEPRGLAVRVDLPNLASFELLLMLPSNLVLLQELAVVANTPSHLFVLGWLSPACVADRFTVCGVRGKICIRFSV